MDGRLSRLLTRARGPAGPAATVDFGAESGPLAELAELLSSLNGFAVFNAGVQVFRAGEVGLGPDLATWNAPETASRTVLGESLADWAAWLLADRTSTAPTESPPPGRTPTAPSITTSG
ncbi:hypothetical protein EV193_10363 [Herbihabitans rhizosphaerae]|uniref:Uncharacterized protein n=1 Tax=Herbihabitans rhizosphaerae TaxID=1872711 RepID=A0A4Q7KWU0_9PSEU|nr:hypothetical protein [Herbihabitans rhizosphaerae]RZS40750.1 hypothetical protein EV193_10363 [Herbihabitans rhizosphaerae]